MDFTGGGVAASINGMFNLLGQGFQMGADRAALEKQNEYNLEMWNLQNEYNSPKEQMKRLEEAGLNPNLMYGQGTTGNAQSAPRKEAFRPDFKSLLTSFNVLEIAKAAQELKGMKLENDTRRAMNMNVWTDTTLHDVHARQEIAQAIADQYIGEFYDYNPRTGMLERNAKSDADWKPFIYGIRDAEGNYVPANSYDDKMWRSFVNQTIHKYNTKSFFNLEQNNILHKQGLLQGNELFREGILYQPWRLKTGWWNNQVGQGVNTIYKGTQIFNPSNYMVPQHFHNNFNYNY